MTLENYSWWVSCWVSLCWVPLFWALLLSLFWVLLWCLVQLYLLLLSVIVLNGACYGTNRCITKQVSQYLWTFNQNYKIKNGRAYQQNQNIRKSFRYSNDSYFFGWFFAKTLKDLLKCILGENKPFSNKFFTLSFRWTDLSIWSILYICSYKTFYTLIKVFCHKSAHTSSHSYLAHL